jgi:tetratricopeptide (TPR) repeat protein
VTTGSLEALRKYSEAYRANGTEQNPAKAVGLAHEAVALDSGFAMAWRLLGQAWLNAGMPRPSADSALERAYRLRGKLSEREQRFVEATYWRSGPLRNRPASIAGWEAVMAGGNAADTSAAANYLALEYVSRRQYDKADSLYALAIRTDSTQAFPYTSRVANLVNTGRLADAQRAADLAVRHDAGNPQVTRVTTELLYHQGKFADLKRRVDSIAAGGDRRLDGWARSWQMALALREGKLREWERLGGQAKEDLNRGVYRAAVAMLRGKPEQGARHLEELLAGQPLSAMPRGMERPYLTLAAAFAVLGRPRQARALLAEYARATSDTAQLRRDGPTLHSVTGEVLLAERRYAEAMREFRSGDSLPDGPANGCQICLPEELGRAFDAAGERDSAIARYEQLLTLDQWGRPQQDVLELPAIHERLAALYEGKGDKRKAAEHYRALIALWKNADPELQPRVAAAQAGVRRVAEVEGR